MRSCLTSVWDEVCRAWHPPPSLRLQACFDHVAARHPPRHPPGAGAAPRPSPQPAKEAGGTGSVVTLFCI